MRLSTVEPEEYEIPIHELHPIHRPLRHVFARAVRIPLLEELGGRTFRLEVEDRRGGPTAWCALCERYYSTSIGSPLHACLEIPVAAASIWDPHLRALQRREELTHPRAARGRPHTPHVILGRASEVTRGGRSYLGPAASSAPHARRRCYCCRKPIGSKVPPKIVTAILRGQALTMFAHGWCRP